MKLFRRRQAEDQDRLESGLEKTREGIFGKIGRLVKESERLMMPCWMTLRKLW